MAKILVAEDSQTQAVSIRAFLERVGHTVRVVGDGEQALAEILREPPEIVLTDMYMPGKNGLELTESVRKSLPEVPVVLMTADGTADISVKALQKGASNFIPKRLLQRDLITTIDGVISILEARKTRASVLSALTHSEATFTFGNDRDFAATLISHFESELRAMNYDDETTLFRIVTALKEAIINAIDHGNLELDTALRDQDDGAAYYELAEKRLTREPYCYRQVTVTARISPEQLAFVIRDEGPGFDTAKMSDKEAPENMLRSQGRGLLLIRTFMDDVVFNDTGNQVTLISYREIEDTSDEGPMLSKKRDLKILMAEDSATNRVLAKSLLEREGHVVEVAVNGIEAVKMSADEEFDLILMDLEMPEQDGLSATKEIREREQSTEQRVAIIAMTSHDADEDRKRCHDAGMDGHLGKPVTSEKLLDALSTL